MSRKKHSFREQFPLRALFLSLVILISCLALLSHTSRTAAAAPALVAAKEIKTADPREELYTSLHLDAMGLSHEAFEYGLQGLNRLASAGKVENSDILSIVDFSLPSASKRLFVINLKTGELLFNTLVSHGRNSGRETATAFSNEPNSFKSSLGFYVTGTTYQGHHGYSLKLAGQEQGINDKAESRGIVMHCAPYVDEKVARAQGYIGRSQGCPAIPSDVYKEVIGKIRNGTCLFLYSPDKFYASHSTILQNNLG